MAKLERDFQKDLMDEIRDGYIQGIPDWTILYKDKWAVLEAKKSKTAKKQPNQPYYVEELDKMSFARFVYPENKDEVLSELHKLFSK